LFAASGAEWAESARRVTVTDPTACWFASMDSTSTPCWPIMSAVRQHEWIIEITLIPDQVGNGNKN